MDKLVGIIGIILLLLIAYSFTSNPLVPINLEYPKNNRIIKRQNKRNTKNRRNR